MTFTAPEYNARKLDDRDVVVTKYGFGLFDKKGREIGAVVQTSVEEFVPAVEGDKNRWRHAVGVFFTYTPQATRGGKGYGASFQDTQRFPTAEARDAGVAKYLKLARKRAEKTVAAGK